MAWRVFFVIAVAAVVIFHVNAVDETSDDENWTPVRSKRATKGLGGVSLKIATIAAEPYTTVTNTSTGLAYTGFVPDLMKRLATRMKFKCNFYQRYKYGSLMPNNTWTGIVGDLIKREKNQSGGVDLAAAPLTITSLRESVVDFVKPFQHIGLTLVMKKPHFSPKTQTSTSSVYWPYEFNIFLPLTAEVWCLVSLFILLVGIVLWLINRFNPYEWSGRHNVGLATEEQAESFNLQGSLWFVFTSLQWQGFDRAPRSLGAKVLTLFWFAFVTIVLVTYTASLVNHLFWASMVQGEDPTDHPIKSIEDLVLNKEYTYGCVRGGSTLSYIKNAARRSPEFKVISKFLSSAEGYKNLVPTTSDGLARVRSDPKFAFIMESSTAEYYTLQRPCDLMTVGDKFGLRSFGFALPKNSPYLEDFHREILMLAESGEIEFLERKWWEMNSQCWNLTQVEKAVSATSKILANTPKRITLHMFVGPLVMMAVGVILAILVTVTEVLFYKYRGRYQSSNRPQGQILKMDPDEGNI